MRFVDDEAESRQFPCPHARYLPVLNPV